MPVRWIRVDRIRVTIANQPGGIGPSKRMQESIVQRNVTLSLTRTDIGQILDAVAIAAEQWEATHDFIISQRMPDDVVVRDCDDAIEADTIARTYRDIIRTVESQLPK